jgi:hypothetical protein
MIRARAFALLAAALAAAPGAAPGARAAEQCPAIDNCAAVTCPAEAAALIDSLGLTDFPQWSPGDSVCTECAAGFFLFDCAAADCSPGAKSNNATCAECADLGGDLATDTFCGGLCATCRACAALKHCASVTCELDAPSKCVTCEPGYFLPARGALPPPPPPSGDPDAGDYDYEYGDTVDCYPCTECAPGEAESAPCTTEADRVCAPGAALGPAPAPSAGAPAAAPAASGAAAPARAAAALGALALALA